MIFNSRYGSYTKTVERRKLILRLFLYFLIFYVALQIIFYLFAFSLRVGSQAMQPTINQGDHIIASPLLSGPHFGSFKLPSLRTPQYGDIVVISPPYAPQPSFMLKLLDDLVRFLTLQNISVINYYSKADLYGPFVKRIIALPGDTVSMKDYTFIIKARGATVALSEFELAKKRYTIIKPQAVDNWQANYPLSQNMEAYTLGKNEYFVASDNRAVINDSRLWGALPLSNIDAYVLLRYFPFPQFGSP